MSEPLKPQFWVLRQNGAIVPLIAMDEIPHNIRVEGVPRTMTIKDTIGMVNIGEYPSRHRHHQVQDTNKSSDTYKHMPTRPRMVQDARFDEESMASVPTKDPVELFAAGPKKSYGIGEQPPSGDESETNTSTTKTTTPTTKVTDTFGKFEELPPWKDSSKLGPRQLVPGKKVYCTHWMSTGECDYAQQGCLYKHEMPFDLQILNFLGYQDIPKWYREKHGIGKLTATPGSGASISGPGLQSAATSAGAWRAASSTGSNRAGRGSITTPDRGSPKPTNKPWRGNKNQSRRGSHNQQQPASLIDLDSAERPSRPRTVTTVPANQTQAQTQTTNPLSQSKFATTTTIQPTQPASTLPNFHPSHSVPKLSRPGTNSGVTSYLTYRPDSPNDPPNTASTRTSGSSSFVLPTPTSRPSLSRRSSLYSDIEAEYIRDNELRRATEEAEYALIVAAKKAADAEKERVEKCEKEEKA